ncbi:invasion associated locus B family protein [Rhizobium leguminosarum bv. viciae]|nr:invasion associated locus B family protein [Rhizobium leguminosarum bv. viciae]NKL84290.1 invasion associated locus B family protein [Rhizobium leguminosarum bv. viciae]NKL93167.1 invasion associated locus B family protein [Rhizobium leguminosarum bv. viciae]NKM94869.1 invasion associated locus B family protein [Rhizobium leguminosarum bv. viciae]
MGFRSLAQSLLLTACIAAAATTPVFAQQQPTPSQAEPPASAPAPAPAPAQQQPSAAKPNVEPVTPGQTQPPAPGTVKSNHGAWSVVCDKPAGAATEQCALMQNVIAEDRPEVGLSVVVLKTADRKSKILRVLAPLGVLLPNGLGLNVDGKDIGRAYFVRCFADGCYAEVVLEDELLKTFRSGAQATFIVFQTPEEGIGIPVDLKGFAEGFDALP